MDRRAHLYGRNATGGSINVITRKPADHLEGYVELGYGNYNALTAEGAISGPLAEGVGLRLAYTGEHRDGYGKNIVTGNDIDNARRFGFSRHFERETRGKRQVRSDRRLLSRA